VACFFLRANTGTVPTNIQLSLPPVLGNTVLIILYPFYSTLWAYDLFSRNKFKWIQCKEGRHHKFFQELLPCCGFHGNSLFPQSAWFLYRIKSNSPLGFSPRFALLDIQKVMMPYFSPSFLLSSAVSLVFLTLFPSCTAAPYCSPFALLVSSWQQSCVFSFCFPRRYAERATQLNWKKMNHPSPPPSRQHVPRVFACHLFYWCA